MEPVTSTAISMAATSAVAATAMSNKSLPRDGGRRARGGARAPWLWRESKRSSNGFLLVHGRVVADSLAGTPP